MFKLICQLFVISMPLTFGGNLEIIDNHFLLMNKHIMIGISFQEMFLKTRMACYAECNSISSCVAALARKQDVWYLCVLYDNIISISQAPQGAEGPAFVVKNGE